MKLYTVVTDNGEKLGIAATTIDHAAMAFISVWMGRTGTHPGAFSITMGSPPEFEGDQTAEAIRLGDETGMLVRHGDGVVHFEPAFGDEHG